MRERLRAVVVWLCCLVLLIPALGAATWIVAAHVHELRSFQPVQATIVAASVGDGPGRGANYEPVIQYTYEVGGRKLSSSRFRGVYWKSDYKSGPQAIVDRYPPGSSHTAWVDPAHPEYAVLERNLNWLGLILALAACAIPIGLLVAFYRMPKPAPAPQQAA